MRVGNLTHVVLHSKIPIESVFKTFEFATFSPLTQWGESSNSNVWMRVLNGGVGKRDASSVAAHVSSQCPPFARTCKTCVAYFRAAT